MNSKILPIILGISLFPAFLIDSASAQCIQSHNGIQLDISKNENTRQNHEIEMDSSPSCSGNTSSSTSIQTNIGGEGAEQNQGVIHSNSSSRPNPSGVDAPTIKNGVVIPVRVKTPNTPIDFP